MHQDKYSVYSVLISDSLATCNLYIQANIYMQTQTTYKHCVFECSAVPAVVYPPLLLYLLK